MKKALFYFSPCLLIIQVLSQPSEEPENNQELEAMYQADQKERLEGNLNDPQVRKTIYDKDKNRRSRVLEFIENDLLQTGSDFYHAAMILQHGEEPDHYLLAHVLATLATANGVDGIWLTAASLDRFLMTIDRAQVFGTQFSGRTVSSDGTVAGTIELQPVSDLLTESIRQAYKVPSKEEQMKRAEEMNRRKF